MDLTIDYYDHLLHYPYFWSIYARYWSEVNGEDLEKVTNILENDKVLVTTKLEQKLRAVSNEKKVKMVALEGQVVGFIQYLPLEGSALYVDALYVLPEKRFNGVTRFILSSFPNLKKCLFECHQDRLPSVFLTGAAQVENLGPTGDRDLNLYSIVISSEVKNEEKMTKAKDLFDKQSKKLVRV